MNLSHIDLNLLVALDALLRERNVTHAGDSIGLSQPAMSNALSRLRKLFNDDLLVRVGRRYELTPLAEELAAPVADILHRIEETIERRPEFDPAVDSQAFTIAASDYAIFTVFQPLLERMFVSAPGVSFHIVPLSGTDESLETGDVDLIIRPAEMETKFPKQVLFKDRWVCAVWAGHPEVGDNLTLDQYLSMPHLAFGNSRMQLAGLGDLAVEATHRPRRVELTIGSFFLLPFLLRGTHLVALIHERMGKRLAELADVRLLEPPVETPMISEAMIWHPRKTSDPAHCWLREQLVDIAASL